jgi:hypothetical protein
LQVYWIFWIRQAPAKDYFFASCGLLCKSLEDAIFELAKAPLQLGPGMLIKIRHVSESFSKNLEIGGNSGAKQSRVRSADKARRQILFFHQALRHAGHLLSCEQQIPDPQNDAGSG